MSTHPALTALALTIAVSLGLGSRDVAVQSQAAAEEPPTNVPAELRQAHEWLLVTVEGLRRSVQVSYERQGSTVRFRATPSGLVAETDSLAEGQIVLDDAGLVSLTVERGSGNLRRHRELRRLVNRLGVDGPELALLLAALKPRFTTGARQDVAAAIAAMPLRSLLGASLVVDDLSFNGRTSGLRGDPDVGDALVAWTARVHTGRGANVRRYDLTLEPIGGSVIALERRQ